MFKTNLGIFCVLLLAKSSSQPSCDSTLNIVNGALVQWPSTHTEVLSRPYCLDENKEFMYRKCQNGVWEPAPVCTSLQLEDLSECPKGFFEARSLCYLFTPISAFPPKCPFDNVVPFDLSAIFISDLIMGTIWAPAKREGLSFMKWIEPSEKYRTEVENYNFSKPLKDKNCLIYSKGYFTAVSCFEQYRGLCAYQKLNKIVNNVCGTLFTCLQSDFSTRSTCFCKSKSMQFLNYPKAEFVKPYQNTIFNALSNETCAIGLKKSNGTYIWDYSGEEIDYTYWSSNVTFGKDHIYGAGTSEGWILTEHPVSCWIFEKDIEDLEPSLHLDFNDTRNSFLVTVTNSQKVKSSNSGILLQCYTNSDNVHLIFRYKMSDIIQNYNNSMLYEFKPIENFAGYYWCEMFKHIDSKIIKSEAFLYKPTNHLEFVGIFHVTYPDDINPLSKDIISFLKSIYLLDSNIYNVRVMKIIDLDEEKHQVSLNVHFTSQTEILEEESENQYNRLQKSVASLLRSVDTAVSMTDFLSADFCLAENGVLTWPRTPLGSAASPSEFCFNVDGTPVAPRECNGDFLEGARWAQFENCEIFKESPLTRSLIEVFANSSLDPFEETREISENYEELNALDLYLIGKTYNEFLIIPNVYAFAETVDNILQIDRNILMEAQLKLRATDKLLYSIDHVTFKYTDSFFINNLTNFACISLESKDLSGLVVQNCIDDKCSVTKLIGNHSFEDIAKIENVESAIWLSPELRDDLKETDRLTFSLYFDDAFFLENETVQTSRIFGVTTPESLKFFGGSVKVLHRVEPHHHRRYYCAYWSYSLSNQGGWKRHGTADFSSPFVFCEFWHPANFALLRHEETEEDNVTDDLHNLLESNNSVSETMEQLSHISQKYRLFQAVDVSFVGKILEKVSDSKDVDLDALAKTVNNVQEVKREVLAESEIEEGATDMILSHVDVIVQKRSESRIQIVTDHFMIVVSDLKEDFSGVVLLHREKFFEPKILNSTVTVEDVISEEEFDSAVILSSELRNQMNPDSKIIITLYSSDALFNEKSPNHSFVSKIFGVILPEMEKFKGPLSILYKTDQINPECAYWYYDHLRNISGSWKKDGKVRNLSQIVQCDFWHTTHFAYLILDDDKYVDTPDEVCDLLDLLTSINCIISGLGLGIIILTAILFKQWRRNTGNKILLNFSLVVIIQIVVFYVSREINQVQDYLLCTIIGIVLHYSIVSQFCWMLVVAILQFRRFVTVLEAPPNCVLLKACVCGWVLPLLPVACVFALDKQNYVKSNVGLCYPSGLGLYLGVWLPVSLIIVINFIIFSITLFNVIHKKTECVNVGSCDIFYQWRLAILLFFMLGFTWSFGFLAELKYGLVFEYLFCMTATLQGFILFLFFIVLNYNTRYLYINAVGRCCKRKFK